MNQKGSRAQRNTSDKPARRRSGHNPGKRDWADSPYLKGTDRLKPERPIVEFARRVEWQQDSCGPELHVSFEVGIVVEGTVRRNHGSGWFELGRGQAWIVAPIQAHRWAIPEEGYSRLVFQMLPSFLERLPAIGKYDLMRPFLMPARLGPIGKDPLFRRQLAETADRIYANRPAGGVVSAGQALFDFMRLIPMIAQEVLKKTPRHQAELRMPPREHSVYPAMELAERCTNRVIGLNEAAEACGMARSLFTRTFRGVMGISFAQFHLRSRLALAAEMLRHTSAPLKAVAARFGFSDVSHFHKCFVRQYQVTPGEYRQFNRQNMDPH